MVIAGSRNRLFLRNVKLPSKITFSSSSSIAGTKVTSVRNANRIASLPTMYSERISGFDR